MNKIQEMKAGELAIAERAAGLSISTLEDPNYPKTPLLIALGWVLEKRANPTLTMDDYGMKYSLTEIVEQLGLNEDE